MPLRPDTPNALAVTAVWAGGRADAAVTVRQIDGQPDGVLRGQVFDGTTGEPGQGVHIRYGAVSTTTDSAGGFELRPVPDGTVVAVVDKPDHLPRLASAVVAGGRGDAGPTLIQRLAPAQIVGPEGYRFSGTGWDVDIPAGALDEPTALRVTPLALSGSVEGVRRADHRHRAGRPALPQTDSHHGQRGHDRPGPGGRPSPRLRPGQFLPINWDGPIFSAPANLAGGVGGADERHITGPVRLIPHATGKGVRTRVTLEADVTPAGARCRRLLPRRNRNEPRT